MDGMYGGYGQITGPNNARCVVWAIGIFFSLWVFYILTIFMYSICLIDVLRDWQEGKKRKMGPNDAKHVVWAISEFIIIIIRVYYIY